jgi:hypothetical protein
MRQPINIDFRSYTTSWSSISDWDSKDETGRPIPWYTYPAIEYLSHLDLSSFSVFECGSGNSTEWWASNAREVTSIEHNLYWFNKIKDSYAPRFLNLSYSLETNITQYVKSAKSGVDIIGIDGECCNECARHVAVFNDGAMLILDNSDWFPDVIEHLQKKLKWVQLDFHGFDPINNYTWSTTVFINPYRSSEIKYKRQLKPKCSFHSVQKTPVARFMKDCGYVVFAKQMITVIFKKHNL